MYIYKNKVCFHSYFNDKTLFVGETALVIPIDDINSIQKKMTAMIFDNGISFNTKKGEITFASFLARDDCIILINKLINKEEIDDIDNNKPEKKNSGDN